MTATFRLKFDGSQFTAGMRKAKGALDSFGASAKNIGASVFGGGLGKLAGAAAAYVGIQQTVSHISAGMRDATEYAREMARVREVMMRTGVEGDVAGEVQAIERRTGFDDAMVAGLFARAFEAGAGTVEEASNRVRLALDLEATKHIDAAGALDVMARASVDNMRRLGFLARELGIFVDETSSANDIIRALHEKVGGLAERMHSAGGEVEAARVDFENLRQDLGGFFVDLLGGAYRGFKDFLGDSETREGDIPGMLAAAEWRRNMNLGRGYDEEVEKRYQEELSNIRGWQRYFAQVRGRKSYEAPRVKGDEVRKPGYVVVDVRAAPGVMTSAAARR